MAVLDRWRADPSSKSAVQGKKRGKSRGGVSEDEDSDDSSSDESSSDDNADDSGDDSQDPGKKQEAKKAKLGSSKEVSGTHEEPDSDDEMAQFEAFKKFQAMKKKSKMGS